MTEQEEIELAETERVARRFCALDLHPDRDHTDIRDRLAATLDRDR